jgi:hypothetical protein
VQALRPIHGRQHQAGSMRRGHEEGPQRQTNSSDPYVETLAMGAWGKLKQCDVRDPFNLREVLRSRRVQRPFGVSEP